MTIDTETLQQGAPVQQRNTVGLIALILAISGTVFAVIPGAALIGWLLLPAAFVLAIVSLFLKNQKRGQGITALIISIVGTLVGVLAFVAMVGNAVDEAFTDDVEIQTPADEPAESAAQPNGDQSDEDTVVDEEAPAGDADGTRANPLPLGSTISTDNWEVTVNAVNLDATDVILAENTFNDAPEDGHVYIMVELSATYVGSDPEGDSPWVGLEYVSASGNSFETYDAFVSEPNSFDRMGTLYEGASTTGNIALQVPADDVAGGALRVIPTLFGDPMFFAVQ